MTCATCGSENPVGRRFCDECGSPLEAACPSCGEKNRVGARFCGNCGTELSAAEGSQPSGAAAARSPVSERRVVSVLFADIVGFTSFAEGRDAERVRETLSRYFDQTRMVIERHGGIVEKFIGDAVMAVWGTPVAREDDAERAVRAALELLPAVRAVDPALQARVGVLTGEAAVSVGASGEGMVAGDLVNTAARLQATAEPGTVLVGETTMLATTGAIAFEPAGEQSLKGKTAPIAAWRATRLVGTTGGRTRAAVLEPPFVGRDEELELLKESVHAASRDGRARLVAVTGPAGIGKSRLAWELEKYLDGLAEDVTWLRGRSPSYGESIAFWALGEMVRRLCGLAENDDEATTRARVGDVTREYVLDERDRGWVEPALLTLLGTEPAPPGGSEVLFAAWRMFLEAIAGRTTTVLVFEDLQWADSGLLDFVDHLLEWSKATPLVVLALTRPELFDARPDFGRGNTHFQALPLRPLPDAAMDALLAGLVPNLDRDARRSIVARADGIPLYAVETIRMLVSDGRLKLHDDGTLSPTRELGDLTIPDTLRSLIASRLDGLDAVDRALLQHASVLGLAFTVPALLAVADLTQDELARRLRALVRRDLLTVQADPRSPERGQYAFVQSVIREVAYGMLGRRERRQRHLAAARFHEATGDEETAGAVATHYLAAHGASDAGSEADAVAVQARIALRAAADRASALGSHAQALNYLEQAAHVATDPHDVVRLTELAAGAADAAGQSDRAATLGRSAVDRYRALGDGVGAARATALLATVLIHAHRLTDAAGVLEPELDRVPDEAKEVRAELLSKLARVRMRTDRTQDAIAAADQALAIAERLNLTSVVGDALVNKGAALSELGRRREGAALLQAGADVAAEAGDMLVHLRGLLNLSVTVADDNPLRALDIATQALQLERRLGYPSTWLVSHIAAFQFWMGDDWDETLRSLDEAAAATEDRAQRLEVVGPATMIRFFRGEAGPADVDRIQRDADATDDPRNFQGWASGVAADQALTTGDLAKAHRLYLRTLGYSALNPVAVEHAFRAAFWLGDLNLASAVVPRLDALPFTGRGTTNLRRWAAAGMRALQADYEAAAEGLLAAVRQAKDEGFQFAAALYALDSLHLVPDDPRVVAEARGAREVFERVGARPLLERLDRLLAGLGPAAMASNQSTEPTSRPAEASPL